MLDLVVFRRGRNVNEMLGVVLKNDAGKRVTISVGIGETIIRGCGDGYTFLPSTTFKHDDNVFLQNVIILESLISCAEQVDMLDGCLVENEFPEGPIVGTITETAGNDRNDLPTWLHKFDSKRHESGIKVNRFNPNLPEQNTVPGRAVDFFIRRIQDRMGKTLASIKNQIYSLFNKISCKHGRIQGKFTLVIRQRSRQMIP